MKRQRSASYPPHTINYALDFTQKIYKIYGNNYRSKREEIASALNVGVGTLTEKISASVQYGFLHVKPKEGYKVTELFVRCYRPLNVEDKNLAIREAFKNPKLYATLLETFEGDILPPLRPLSNILLHNHNISEKACEKAANVFEENLEELGYLKDGRILDLNTAKEDFSEVLEEDFEDEEFQEEEVDIPKSHEQFPIKVVDKDTGSTKDEISHNGSTTQPIPHNIPLKGKLPAQLLLPSSVSAADFDFIISYIGLIRNQY